MQQHRKPKQHLKAFLLVAGRGKRLRPLTDTTPKCLLPINGVPLLQIWLEHLERSGIYEILINTHWLHEMVEEFVKQWSAKHDQIKIDLFHEPILLGSAGTIQAQRNWAGKGPFFIIYGDNLTNIDLNRFLAHHNEYGLPLTMRVYKASEPKRVGIVSVNAHGIVTEFEEKPKQPKSNLGAGAIYVADERIFDYFPGPEEIPADGILDLSYHVLPRMVGKMKAYDSGEFSLDIGTPESYAIAQSKWSGLLQVN
jgi:mannose-1-phosphate guanylyltransferase